MGFRRPRPDPEETAWHRAERVLLFQTTGRSTESDLATMKRPEADTPDEALGLSIKSLQERGNNRTSTKDSLEFVDAGSYVAAPRLDPSYVMTAFAQAGFTAELVNQERSIYKVKL